MLNPKDRHKLLEEDPLGNMSMQARTYSEAGCTMCTMHKSACNLCKYCSNNTPPTVASNFKEALIKSKSQVTFLSKRPNKLQKLEVEILDTFPLAS